MIKFNVAKTYDVVTEESASQGDFAESGYVYETKSMSLRDVLDEINSLGCYENFQPEDLSQSLYQIDPDLDYSSGDETREALHIDASPRAMRRLNKLIKAGL